MKCCGDCIFFKVTGAWMTPDRRGGLKEDYKTGDCNYKFLLPDKTPDSISGFKNSMRSTRGKGCPCYEGKK